MTKKAAQIVIIGGGPAGCAAAISAKNHGADEVIIIEKSPYGRHRIGEILLTQTILEIDNLGLSEELRAYADKYQWGRKFAAAYVHGQDRTPWKVQNNHPLSSTEDQAHIPRCFVDEETQLWYTLMVRRHEFDESLREMAQKRGVEFIYGSVKDLHLITHEQEDQSFISWLEVEPLDKSPSFRINAQFVIDATGQQAFIPRKIGAREVVDDWSLQARYTYLSGVNFEKAKEHGLFHEGANIISFEDGWAWIAYLGRDLTSVGIVSKKWDKEDRTFWKKFTHLPEYSLFDFDKATTVDYMGEVAASDNVYAHPNYRFRSQIMRGKNWACTGDAAMFLDPLLSQGVTLALSFGNQLGHLAYLITTGEAEAQHVLVNYEKSYISEMEVLNKIVSQWYEPNFTFDNNWAKAASNISNIFGREIKNDVESFRWVSNLENIHHIIKDKNDEQFLREIDSVNSIKMIHNFEKYHFLKT